MKSGHEAVNRILAESEFAHHARVERELPKAGSLETKENRLLDATD